MPAPWDAIPRVVEHLDKNEVSRICCYSPCMEQVHSCVKSLQASGFIGIAFLSLEVQRLINLDIVMYECLARPYDIKKTSMNKWKKKVFPFMPSGDALTEDVSMKEGVPMKRTASEADADAEPQMDANGDPVDSNETEPKEETQKITTEDGSEIEMTMVARPTATIRGHTSYLTFAKFIPSNF